MTIYQPDLLLQYLMFLASGDILASHVLGLNRASIDYGMGTTADYGILHLTASQISISMRLASKEGGLITRAGQLIGKFCRG